MRKFIPTIRVLVLTLLLSVALILFCCDVLFYNCAHLLVVWNYFANEFKNLANSVSHLLH
jgi:hypothetical protein